MKKYLLISLTSALFLLGCSSPVEQHAKVIDSAVEGLEVQCSGLTAFTPKNGSVSCSHMPLGFKLGEIKLGIIYDMPKDGIILPQDILGVDRSNIKDKNVRKLLVILQSLDSDGNPENGITISKETRKKLSTFVDLKKISLAELKDLIEGQLGNTVFKDEKSAVEHLQKSMKKYGIAVPKVNLDDLE